MGKHTDELGTLDNFQAPWETETGTDQELNPPKLKKYLFNLLQDKAKAQDARDEHDEKVKTLETELQTAKDEVAKGDPTGKIADLEKKLEKATSDGEKAKLDLARLEVGIDKGLTPKQAARLQGNTKEELEADADEILETFGVTKREADEDDDEDEEDEDGEADLIRRIPRGSLVNPSDPSNSANQEPDYDKIAAEITGSRISI